MRMYLRALYSGLLKMKIVSKKHIYRASVPEGADVLL